MVSTCPERQARRDPIASEQEKRLGSGVHPETIHSKPQLEALNPKP